MQNVKVLLKESIKHVGKVGDIVEVRAGYARNYLLPHDLAVEPTPGNIKKVEAKRAEIERVERERLESKKAILAKMQDVEVTLERKANDQGHLFGSVGATDIAKALQANGYDVQPDEVLLPGKLDKIEKYTVKVQFADDLTTEVKVWVAPDAESKQAIDAAQKARAEAAKAADEASTKE